MANVIPLKGRYSGSDAIALGELETGDTIAATWLDLSGVGGASDFVSLTDTPANFTGASEQFVRVNTAGDALEYHDLLGAANNWTAEQTFTETKETVYALSGTTPAIDPANGTIQTWTLSGASTPTDALQAGQSVTLMIAGTASTITWPTTQWTGGSAPTLPTTGTAVIVLWKVGATLYGSHIGDAS